MDNTKPENRRRKYRPLDVKTWFEGFLRLLGWILVIIFSVMTGALFVVYEIKILNRHDVDFRDMHFDQRITNDINNRYHKNFLLAEQCSNPDPVYFPGQTELFPTAPPLTDWASIPPYCKPVVVIECTDIRTAACNATRVALYDAAGLALTPGTPYVNCLRAGRVRVGVVAVPAGRPISLVAYLTKDADPYDALVINSPFDINATQVQQFVDRVAAAAANSTNSAYVQPSTQLSRGVYLAGVQVAAQLRQLSPFARNLRAVPPWTAVSNLWPWPGMNKRCQNTGKATAYHITGSASITLPRFSLAHPDDSVIALTVAGVSLLVGAWSITPAQQPPSQELGGSTDIRVSYLTGVQAAIGQVPLVGPCGGWQFSPDPADLVLTYTTHWTGSLAALQAGTTFGPFAQHGVDVDVRDVAAPRAFALPSYGGMYYIFGAFVMAFVWMVSNGLILFIIILVWWNIRSNKGLPPIIYRYMKKYRGW